MKARTLLDPGESAIVIFTKGPHFEVNADSSGSTGYWKISPNRKPERVIIYARAPGSRTAIISVADHGGIEKREADGRYKIYLENVTEVGTTENTWLEFAEGGQYPIRYIDG